MDRLPDIGENDHRPPGVAAANLASPELRQEVRDLRAKIAALANTTSTDINKLESDFVRVEKQLSERRGIGYGAWRDAGVPPHVLKRAGVKRTRA